MARKRKQKEVRSLHEKSAEETISILTGGEEGKPKYPRLVVILASLIQEYSEGKTLTCDGCGANTHNILYDDADMWQSFCCNCIRQAEHLARVAQIGGINLLENEFVQAIEAKGQRR